MAGVGRQNLMERILRASLLACLLSCAPSRGTGAGLRLSEPQTVSPARWYQISPRSEPFSFQMPAVPRLYVDYQDDGSGLYRVGGAVIKRQSTYHAYQDGVIYLVQVYKTSSPEALLNGLAGMPPLKGAAAREVSAEGISGVEYEAAGDTFYAKARFVKSGKVLYELQALAREKGNPAFDRFLSSLRTGTVNPAQGAEVIQVAGTPAQAAAGGDANVEDVQPLAAKDVTRKAAVFYKPEPTYTDEARRRNITGTVRVRLVLAATGQVTNVSISHGLPGGLTEVAVEAARAIQFLPAEKDGRRVSQYAAIEYNFSIY